MDQRTARWYDGVDRIYLDSGVFDSEEAVDVLRGFLLDDFRALHVARTRAKVVVFEETLILVRALAKERKLAHLELAEAILRDLSTTDYVDWRAAHMGGTRLDVEARIAMECQQYQANLRQVVFTQSRALADLVVGNSNSPADRRAKPVATRCLVSHQHVSWDHFLRLDRDDATFDPEWLPHFRRIVIDACAWMDPSVPGQCGTGSLGLDLVNAWMPMLLNEGISVVVLEEVEDELRKHAKDPESASFPAVQAALSWILDERNGDLVQRVPRRMQGHADPSLNRDFIDSGRMLDSILVTQDVDLARLVVANLPRPPRWSAVVRVDRWHGGVAEWPVLLRTVPAYRDPFSAKRQGDADGPASSAAIANTHEPEPGRQRVAPTAQTAPDVESVADAPASDTNEPGLDVSGADTPAPAAPGLDRETPAAGHGGAAFTHTTQPTADGLQDRSADRTRSSGGIARGAAILALISLAVLAYVWWPVGLRIDVVVNGNIVSQNDGVVTLKTGERFTLRTRAPEAGVLELFVTNASVPGREVLLTRSAVSSRTWVESPGLRIQGPAGVDRIRVRHLPSDNSPPTQLVLEVRHD